jgi:hypothetical protein
VPGIFACFITADTMLKTLIQSTYRYPYLTCFYHDRLKRSTDSFFCRSHHGSEILVKFRESRRAFSNIHILFLRTARINTSTILPYFLYRSRLKTQLRSSVITRLQLRSQDFNRKQVPDNFENTMHSSLSKATETNQLFYTVF